MKRRGDFLRVIMELKEMEHWLLLFSDESGTYDLSTLQAVTKGPTGLAIVHLSGGHYLSTATAFDAIVSTWKNDNPAPKPAAT